MRKSVGHLSKGVAIYGAGDAAIQAVSFLLLLSGPCTTLASRHVASATPAVSSSASGVTAASQQPLE